MKPSVTGTAKAISFWDLDVENSLQKTARFENNEDFPAMVIAVRGSASLVDHMVNANGQQRDAGFLFVISIHIP